MLVLGDAEVTALEKCIDRCQKDLAAAAIVHPAGRRHASRPSCTRRAPSAGAPSAACSSCRASETIDAGAIRYLNRLSDLLFVLSRWIALHGGTPEYLWERGLRLGKKPARNPTR